LEKENKLRERPQPLNFRLLEHYQAKYKRFKGTKKWIWKMQFIVNGVAFCSFWFYRGENPFLD
jgi:hypothetical protein